MLPTYTAGQLELLSDLQGLLGALQSNLAYWQERVLTAHAQVSRLLQERSSSRIDYTIDTSA